MLYFFKKVIFLIILIIFVNIVYCFSNSKIIYPETKHLYHGNLAQKKLNDQLKYCQLKDTVIFGSYDQDGNLINGKEPVEWVVLENDTEKCEALLISKYIIECLRYNGFSESVTWEDSSLRKYLNEDLFIDIFDEYERKCVLDSYVSNTQNIYNNVSSGNDTIDKVFIPSIDDMFNYFTDKNLSIFDRYQELLKPNILRVSLTTPHAMMNGVRIMGVGKKYPTSGNYFLRTSSPNNERIWYGDVLEKNFISFVSEIGEVKPLGTGISSSDDGIRVMVSVCY